MRPDFIPPGQEAQYGVSKGAPRDFIPGPPPPDLPVDKGGSLVVGDLSLVVGDLSLVVGDLSLVQQPTTNDQRPPIVAIPDPGSAPSPVMSPGPATEALVHEGVTPRDQAIADVEETGAEASGPAVTLQPAPAGEPRGKPTAAQKRAALQKEMERLAALPDDAHLEEEEPDQEPSAQETPSDTPESGQKGGESFQGPARPAPGRSSSSSGRKDR